jgi:outer membrane PBP1 activator LpoA protein
MFRFRHLFVSVVALLLCACAAPAARPPADVVERPAPTAPQPEPPPVAAPAEPEPTATQPPAQPPREHIALILPLSSPSFASVADSVRKGFMAAAGLNLKGAPAYRIYAAENEGESLVVNMRNAQRDGAVLIIGGLTRDGATFMARQSLRLPELPMLALNTPDSGASGRFHYVSLALDNEARQLAQLAAGEGAKLATVVHGGSGLAKRIQETFEREWIRLGGQIILRIPFSGDPAEGLRIRAQMENLRNDMVFIAAEPNTARAVRPYIPIWMTTYATSLSADTRADAVTNVDLDGMRFLDMPWFVQPDHPAVMVYPRPPPDTSIEAERLYALGIDAWRLGGLLLNTDVRQSVLDGVTGRLKLEPNGHQFVRTLTPTEFRDGRAAPYGKIE